MHIANKDNKELAMEYIIRKATFDDLEELRELYLAEHSTSFAYLRYYEALSIVRGARIGVDHATCFGTSPTAMRQKLDLL